MLFLAKDRILMFLRPFRLVIFSMALVERDSFTQADRVEREASIFSIGGNLAQSFTSSASAAFFSFSFSQLERASLMEVPLDIFGDFEKN